MGRKSRWSGTTVAVTGLDACDNPHPGIAVAKCLREGGFDGTLLGFTYSPLCTGAYRRDLYDGVCLGPLPTEGSAPLYERLLQLRDEARLDLVIPTLDSEIATYARIAPRLAEAGIRTLLPSETAVKRRGKVCLPDLCREAGIPHPRTETLTVVEQVDKCLERYRCPVVMKGSIADARIAWTADEAKQHYHDLLDQWGYPVLLQERLQGEEYNVCVLCDRPGRVWASVASRKFGVTAKGKGFAGIVVDDPELPAIAARVADALQWVGGMEVECLKEASTGRFHILEINARFPAWVWLTASVGSNLPMALVRIAFGEEVPPPPAPRAGSMFFRNTRTTVCAASELAALVVRGRTLEARR